MVRSAVVTKRNETKKEKRKMAKMTVKKVQKKKVVKVGRPMGQKAVPIAEMIECVVKHHKAGGSQSSAAAELGVTPAAISLRLKYLRDQGVRGLPEFARGAGNSGKTVVERAREALAALGIKG